MATTGDLPHVRIGYSTESQYASTDRGFGGGSNPPKIVMAASDWFDNTEPDPSIHVGERESVIYAAALRTGAGSIGTLELAGLHESNFYPPRIESPTIGSATIGIWENGVLWSGLLDLNGSQVDNDPANDFASASTIDVGCMGQYARAWYTDASYFRVTNNMRGQIHTDALAAPQTIRIGGKIGNAPYPAPNPQACDDCGSKFFSDGEGTCGFPGVFLYEEDSPRDPNRFITTAGYVQVWNDNALAGQVIVNANATARTHTIQFVEGAIRVGQPVVTSPVRFSEDSGIATTGHLLPHYTAIPGDDLSTSTTETGFGGGAVGVVPFAVHEQSSASLQHRRSFLGTTLVNTELLTSEWNRSYDSPPCEVQPAVLDFYGPVTFYDPPPQQDLPTVAIVEWQGSPNYNVTPRIEYTLHPGISGGVNRHLWLQPWGGEYLSFGTYEVTTATGGIQCAGLPSSSGTVPADPTFEFVVALDCPTAPEEFECSDHNGHFNCTLETVEECSCEFVNYCDSIDFNNDTLFPDTLDIDDFLSVFSGGPCSNDPHCGDIDFNNDDLLPDTLDIDALLSMFSGGPCLR